ncbi:hypothetical protein [Streptomyces sp. NPDC053069]|uniref:hypothetical protein n=1 Tax=Streptomyces sp. NPDC053069 TaxID=3365695 RepID=UPI0037D86EEE
MNGRLTWHEDATVELTPGYTLLDADGAPAARLTAVRIALEGGFVHVAVPGVNDVQVISAPGIHRLSYPHPGHELS